jgi:hypothetical protein
MSAAVLTNCSAAIVLSSQLIPSSTPLLHPGSILYLKYTYRWASSLALLQCRTGFCSRDRSPTARLSLFPSNRAARELETGKDNAHFKLKQWALLAIEPDENSTASQTERHGPIHPGNSTHRVASAVTPRLRTGTTHVISITAGAAAAWANRICGNCLSTSKHLIENPHSCKPMLKRV